jgi:hypothetical protein
MSVLGQKRTLRLVDPMSALPPKADIAERNWDVRFVPIADVDQSSMFVASDQISNSRPISIICVLGILKYAPGRWAL